jgi:hypothetical protein
MKQVHFKIFSIIQKNLFLYYLGPVKRARVFSEKSLPIQTESRTLRSRQQTNPLIVSTNHIITSVQTRSNHVNFRK